MKTKLAAAVALTLLAGSSSVAFAQGKQQQNMGFFVEGSVGSAKADIGNTGGFSVDDRDTTYSLTGGYMFNEYIGAEVSYRKLGEASASASGTISGTYYGTPLTATGTLRISAEADGWAFGPRINVPINDKFSLNAKVGWYRWDVDARASASGTLTYGGTAYAANVQASGTDSGTDTYFGFGAAYSFQKNAAIGIGYNRFKVSDTDVDTWDVSLKVSF